MGQQPDTLGNNNSTSTPPQGSGNTGTPPANQGGQTPPQGAQTPPSPGTAPGNNGGQSGADSDADQITMSQTSLTKRIERAGRSATRELLSSMGFENLDSPDDVSNAQTQLGELINYAREQQRAAMTAEQQVQADLEAAQQASQSAQTAHQQAEAERDTARTHLREFVVRSEVISAAVGAEHPADVYDLFARQYAAEELGAVIKEGEALFDENGVFNRNAIDTQKIEKIIEKCKADRPKWWQSSVQRTTPGSPSNASRALPPGTNADANKEERMRQLARRNLR